MAATGSIGGVDEVDRLADRLLVREPRLPLVKAAAAALLAAPAGVTVAAADFDALEAEGRKEGTGGGA
jgi:hypothetical protein